MTTAKKFNFVSGQFEEVLNQDPNEPSHAWLLGWDDFMRNGKSAQNPYPQFTDEYREWLDGFECANID